MGIPVAASGLRSGKVEVWKRGQGRTCRTMMGVIVD